MSEVDDELIRFQIDPENGFLPRVEPLSRLPGPFESWEALAGRVSKLVVAGRLRQVVERMPVVPTDALHERAELERAMLVLSVIGGAYVWGGDVPSSRLPPAVAKPWCDVAGRLGRPPSVAHASVVLSNWRLIEPAEPISLENLETLCLFSGCPDEQWFYLIPAAMEARGAEALRAISGGRTAVKAGNADTVGDTLDTMERVIHGLSAILARTPEKCDPYVFYHRVRPYLTGWPAPGLVYEGVTEEPQKLAGGSAAQSSLIQAIDAGLGVAHEDVRARPFLTAMRAYMPPLHRAFIEEVEAGPSLRDFVAERRDSHPRLTERYDHCIDALDRFRTTHFELAVRYITRQAPNPERAKGTGGTELADFLTATREDTRSKKISS